MPKNVNKNKKHNEISYNYYIHNLNWLQFFIKFEVS